jgi:catalase-peroxidase
MAMDDEETVALIAGGHTFGKAHGAASAATHVGHEPEAATSNCRASAGSNSARQRQGRRRDHQRPGSDLDEDADAWSNNFFENLFGFEWELTKSPGRRAAVGREGCARGDHSRRVRSVEEASPDDAHHRPVAALRPGVREDLAPLPEDPEAFADAFARAWFKLTHRDMGPKSRYLGPEVPAEDLIWQDPIPAADHAGHRCE